MKEQDYSEDCGSDGKIRDEIFARIRHIVGMKHPTKSGKHIVAALLATYRRKEWAVQCDASPWDWKGKAASLEEHLEKHFSLTVDLNLLLPRAVIINEVDKLIREWQKALKASKFPVPQRNRPPHKSLFDDYCKVAALRADGKSYKQIAEVMWGPETASKNVSKANLYFRNFTYLMTGHAHLISKR